MYCCSKVSLLRKDNITKLFSTNAGVKQGDIFSKMFFNLYISDFPALTSTNSEVLEGEMSELCSSVIILVFLVGCCYYFYYQYNQQQQKQSTRYGGTDGEGTNNNNNNSIFLLMAVLLLDLPLYQDHYSEAAVEGRHEIKVLSESVQSTL